MDRKFTIIPTDYWYTGAGKKLRGKAAAQAVMFFLLTAEPSQMTGIFRTTIGAISDGIGISRQQVTSALKQCQDAECLQYDPTQDLFYLPEKAEGVYGAELDPTDNKVKGIESQLRQFSTHPFVGDFMERYGVAYHLDINAIKSKTKSTWSGRFHGSKSLTNVAAADRAPSVPAATPAPACAPTMVQPCPAPPPPPTAWHTETKASDDRVNSDGIRQNLMHFPSGPQEAPSQPLAYNHNNTQSETKPVSSGVLKDSVGEGMGTTTSTPIGSLERPEVVVDVSVRSSRNTPDVDLTSVTAQERSDVTSLWELWKKTFGKPEAVFDRLRDVWLVDAVRSFGTETSALMIVGTTANKFLMGSNKQKMPLVEPRHIFGSPLEHREWMVTEGKKRCPDPIGRHAQTLPTEKEAVRWATAALKALSAGAELPVPPSSVAYEVARGIPAVRNLVAHTCLSLAGKFPKISKPASTQVAAEEIDALLERLYEGDGARPLVAAAG